MKAPDPFIPFVSGFLLQLHRTALCSEQPSAVFLYW